MADTCTKCAGSLSDDDGPICPACLLLPSADSNADSNSEQTGASTTRTDQEENVPDAAICKAGCTLKPDKRSGTTKCLWCHYPFHKKCVSEVYICDTCRTLPAKITTLTESMSNLLAIVKTLTDANLELKQTLCTQTELIKKIDKRMSSVGPPSTLAPKHLLIGSSVVRDVDPAKLANTDVISISGGRIRDVQKRLEDTSATYGRVSIVVGGNDCAAKTGPEPLEDLVDQYKALIQHAKTKSAEVYAGTILPRDDTSVPGGSARIDALNACLLTMDATEGVTIVNNDVCYKLRDASINDGYYNSDLTHLNAAGTNRLAASMQLNIKPQHAKNVCRNHSQAAKANAPKPPQARPAKRTQPDTRQSSSRHSPAHHHAPASRSRHQSPARRTDDASPPHSQPPPRSSWSPQPWSPPRHDQEREDNPGDDGWRTVANSRGSRDSSHGEYRRNRGACEYCNERNHDMNTCHHGRPVQCDTCHHYGHKSKHHSSDNY